MAKKLQDQLRPLCWLLGEWKSMSAVVNFPTMKRPMSIGANVRFTPMQYPLIDYSLRTWNEEGRGLQQENGIFRLNEAGSWTAFMVAQSNGLASVEEGSIEDKFMTTKSTCIGRAAFGAQKATSIARCYKINGKGQLQINIFVETADVPLFQHVTMLLAKGST